jgi:hypothetical protein
MMLNWLRKLWKSRPHKHSWKFPDCYGLYMASILATDRDRVPLKCEICGAMVLGTWRVDKGFIDMKPFTPEDYEAWERNE